MSMSVAPVLLRPFFRWREIQVSWSVNPQLIVNANPNRVALIFNNPVQFFVTVSTTGDSTGNQGLFIAQRSGNVLVKHADFGPNVGESWTASGQAPGPWQLTVFEVVWQPDLYKE